MAIIQGTGQSNNRTYSPILGFYDGSLYGTDDADQIYGYGGWDDLFGNDGNDYLDGGEGADYMNGGWGNDTYVVDNAGDTVDEWMDLYDAQGQPVNAGYDTVYSYVSFTLPTNIEELRLEDEGGNIDGAGNALDNWIYGNSHDNDLFGYDGDDRLFGGAENDTLQGGDGDDRLYGGSHGDSLFGGADNDVLDGGTGGDTMRGEDGDDRYYVDNALDQAIEAADAGRDKVFSSISFTLRANFEDLTLLDGSGAINGTGNGLDNDIIGNDRNNTLNGFDGADRIYGDEGQDTILGGRGEDVLHGGTEGDTLNGEWDRDVLYGDEGGDTLNGGLDNDTMYGGTGNDIYWVDSVGDTVREFENEGLLDIVHVVGLNDYTLTANVENLVLEGTRNGTGNFAANRILGDGLDNTINGGFGNDNLTGGGGADTFVFNTALTKGPNIDTIWDFDTVSDTIQVDNSVFTALTGDQPRSLAGAEFRVGSAALDASDRIIYNNQTGAVLYDADGNGGQGAVQFATLDAGLSVTAADFWVV